MARETVKCPYCNKIAEVVNEQFAFGRIIKKYSCGHSVTEKIEYRDIDVMCLNEKCHYKFRVKENIKDHKYKCPLCKTEFEYTEAIRDDKWNLAFEFQRQGVEFAEKSNYKCLIGDEMGLGKTIQAILTWRYNYKNLSPWLIVCPASLVYNWQREIIKWGLDGIKETDIHNGNKSNIYNLPCVHRDGQLPLFPGFDIYIVSQDLLHKKIVSESIKEIPFKFLVVDEVHGFKNSMSKRTGGLFQTVQHIPHRVLLSGTPVLNRFTEYFTALNLIKPDHWPSREVMYRYCATDIKGKVLGVAPWKIEEFFFKTKDYIIRRKKAEVLKDLPELMINREIITIEDRQFADVYNKHLDAMELIMAQIKEGVSTMADLMAIMAKLRHLCALAKVRTVVEYVVAFLTSADDPNEKITVGIHHKDVAEFIIAGLKELGITNVVTMSGADNAEQKEVKEQKFRDPANRVLIANILAAGEGRNLQFCNHCVIVERQWNPAKEQQFIGRFHRQGQKNAVTANFMLLKDTIDDYFEEMVMMKEKICNSTLDEQWNYENDPNEIFTLAERVTAARIRVVGA